MSKPRKTEKHITRTKGNRYCTLKVSLENGRLSICGSEGRIISKNSARSEAKRYWKSYFDDEPGAIQEMNQRCGTNYRTSSGAAQYAVDTDGEFHGLDIERETELRVFVTESCGQIRETLAEWFPEHAEYFKWHLNDAHAGCEHQDALGWGHGKDIALTSDTMTDKQREVLTAIEQKKVDATIDLEFANIRANFVRGWLRDYWKKLRGEQILTVSVADTIKQMSRDWTKQHKPALAIMSGLTRRDFEDGLKFLQDVRADIAAKFPVKVESRIFKDCRCAPCPECGYRYGTQWLKRELPAEVIQWFESLKAD